MLMCRIFIPILIAVCVPAFLFASALPSQAQTDVLSYHGGTVTSSGVNSKEYQLTPSTVNDSVFGKVFTTAITDVPNTTGMPTSALPLEWK